MGERLVGGVGRGHGLHAHALDANGPDPARRAARIQGERDAVLTLGQRPEQHAVFPLVAARQDEVLLARAVDGEREDPGLAASAPPFAAFARRADHGHGLRRALQLEGLLAERRRRCGKQQEEDAAHRCTGFY